MTEPIEKQCTKCLAFKPLGEFSNDKSCKHGKKAACKCCTNEYARKRHAANPEKRNQSRRKRHAANPEKQREYDRNRYAANPEKYNEGKRKRRAANPEKTREDDRRSKAAVRHARNQCAVINAQDPNKWELLQSKLKAMDSTNTKEKE